MFQILIVIHLLYEQYLLQLHLTLRWFVISFYKLFFLSAQIKSSLKPLNL